jgi:hypothetical protein
MAAMKRRRESKWDRAEGRTTVTISQIHNIQQESTEISGVSKESNLASPSHPIDFTQKGLRAQLW